MWSGKIDFKHKDAHQVHYHIDSIRPVFDFGQIKSMFIQTKNWVLGTNNRNLIVT